MPEVKTKAYRLKYMVQLDALRAIAVLGVLVHHFLPQQNFTNSKLHWGPHGVRLFFVLSGFLITGILLHCRDLAEFNWQNKWFTVKRFYARRFLRLLPVYGLAIFITAIVAFNSIEQSLPWHLTYTSNIYFSFYPWDELTPHFWSLSVEEQFYIAWPFFILWLPKRFLFKAIVSTIIIGLLLKWLMFVFGFADGTREYILTFTCFDSLGLGALLAMFKYEQLSDPKAGKVFIQSCFWIGLPLFIALNFFALPDPYSWVSPLLGTTAASMFFLWLIDRASNGFSGVVGSVLEFQPLLYLGKISYGIYVYHLLTRHVFLKVLNHFNLSYPGLGWRSCMLFSLITILVATVSWHLIEKPINSLKQNFSYEKS